jgi:hypothetical protein
VSSHFKLDTCHLFIFLNNSTKNEIILGYQIHHNDRQCLFKYRYSHSFGTLSKSDVDLQSAILK